MLLEQLDNHMQKEKKKHLQPHLTLYTGINLKWVIDLHIKTKTIKLLEENISDLGFGKDFLNMPPKNEL